MPKHPGMLTLSLLRHAKSAWGDLDLDDHERALAPRGIKAAGAMGRFLSKQNVKPDLILCSGAVRTRATLALILPEIGRDGIDIRYDDALYLAHPSTMLEIIKKAPASSRHVMVIGHNPGTHALALELTGSGDGKDIGELATRYPTAALAVLTLKSAKWTDWRPGAGHLELFVTPRALRD